MMQHSCFMEPVGLSMRRWMCLLAFAIAPALAVSAGCGDDDGGGNNSQVVDAHVQDGAQEDGATQDGAIQDASSSDAAVPTCQSACELVMSCPDVPDRESLFGTTQQSCETACEGSLEQYLKNCILDAEVCGQVGECTRCLTYADIGYCRDLACDFLVNDCGGSDVNQCYIDCEMYSSGAGGCFRGAGRICWVRAANHDDCAAAAICPTIH